jgi:hypothetical protein
LKASQDSKAFRAAKSFSELVNGGKSDQVHQEKRAKQTERIKRRLPPSRRRVKPGQIIAYGVEVKPQEDQGGLKPEGVERARAALEPAG